MYHKKAGGFTAVETIIVILVLVAVVAVGGYAWKHHNKPKTPTPASNRTLPNPTSGTSGNASQHAATKVNLADGAAVFTLPSTWVVSHQPTPACAVPEAAKGITCKAGAAVAPPNAGKTINGDTFSVGVAAYTAGGATTAQSWFTDKYGGSLSRDGDVTATSPINHYDGYYFKQLTNSYTDVWYVALKGDTVALVSARISDAHYPVGSPTPDEQDSFTQYAAAIAALANSVTLQ